MMTQMMEEATLDPDRHKLAEEDKDWLPGEKWFLNCLDFLQEFNWVYDYQVTRLFIERVWEKIPCEWLECMKSLSTQELNGLPYGELKDNWPAGFKFFIQTALKSSLPRGEHFVKPVEIPPDLKLGMNPKKQHEVSRLAGFLHQEMTREGVNTVVDVGAGLGYLGQVLYRVYGYRIISLECDDSRTHGAQKRAKTKGNSSNGYLSLTFNLQDDPKVMKQFNDIISDFVRKTDLDMEGKGQSGSEVKGQSGSEVKGHSGSEVKGHSGSEVKGQSGSEVKGQLGSEVSQSGSEVKVHSESDVKGQPVGKVCMTGLHCCGDLTPSMLQYFTKLDCVTLLVCVGCCYHRMTISEETKTAQNFPMSQSCQRALGQAKLTNGNWALGIPAFRLAAQETRSRWRDQTAVNHEDHVRHVGYRATLELFCHQENLNLKKVCRKVASSSSYSNFDDYVDGIFDRVQLLSENKSTTDTDKLKEKLREVYLTTNQLFHFIEPLTALQVVLQPVLESLIYLDRKTFLLENNLQTDIIALFDENISPRNLVLVSYKGR